MAFCARRTTNKKGQGAEISRALSYSDLFREKLSITLLEPLYFAEQE
jgi:hypothetical protein